MEVKYLPGFVLNIQEVASLSFLYLTLMQARPFAGIGINCAWIEIELWQGEPFTGQYPSTTGFYDDHVYWQADENNRNEYFIGLHTAFDNAGYKTLGTGKLFHHAMGWIDQRGWDQYYLRTDGTTNAQIKKAWDAGTWKYGAPHPGGADGTFVSIYNTTFPNMQAGVMEWLALDNAVEKDMADTRRADWVVSQLNADHGDTPFFLGLGLFTPHSLQSAPQKYYDAYLNGPLKGNIDKRWLALRVQRNLGLSAFTKPPKFIA